MNEQKRLEIITKFMTIFRVLSIKTLVSPDTFFEDRKYYTFNPDGNVDIVNEVTNVSRKNAELMLFIIRHQLGDDMLEVSEEIMSSDVSKLYYGLLDVGCSSTFCYYLPSSKKYILINSRGNKVFVVDDNRLLIKSFIVRENFESSYDIGKKFERVCLLKSEEGIASYVFETGLYAALVECKRYLIGLSGFEKFRLFVANRETSERLFSLINFKDERLLKSYPDLLAEIDFLQEEYSRYCKNIDYGAVNNYKGLCWGVINNKYFCYNFSRLRMYLIIDSEDNTVSLYKDTVSGDCIEVESFKF